MAAGAKDEAENAVRAGSSLIWHKQACYFSPGFFIPTSRIDAI